MKKRRANFKPGSNHALAYHSERLIADNLIGSKHVNEWFDTHLPYDVKWGDIEIDAKATRKLTDNASGQFCYFPMPNEWQHDIIMVYVCYIKDHPTYIWVEHSSKARHRYFIDEAISGFDLSTVITDKHKKYSKMYKNTVDKQLSLL